jgi:hypothetical protein
MDDDTLWANYYAAVCHYIEQNGGVPDDTQFSLVDPGDKKTQIATWKYDFPQPCNDNLQKFNVVDFQDSVECKTLPCQLEATRLLKVTDSQKERLQKRKFVDDGDVVYNQTTKRLEIFFDDAWHGIALVKE